MAPKDLSENVLQVTSFNKEGCTSGPVKTIALEEFLFRQEDYDEPGGPEALKLSMVTCETLEAILEDELNMNKETWETWALYYQPPDDQSVGENEERRIDSDVSLRSAIKLLLASGNVVLPLLLRENIESDGEEEAGEHSYERVNEEEDILDLIDEVFSEDEAELKKDSKSE